MKQSQRQISLFLYLQILIWNTFCNPICLENTHFNYPKEITKRKQFCFFKVIFNGESLDLRIYSRIRILFILEDNNALNIVYNQRVTANSLRLWSFPYGEVPVKKLLRIKKKSAVRYNAKMLQRMPKNKTVVYYIHARMQASSHPSIHTSVRPSIQTASYPATHFLM